MTCQSPLLQWSVQEMASFFFLLLLFFYYHTLAFPGAQGQTDKHKTIWKRSRETLEKADSRAVNKKERIHDVSGEKFMGWLWQEDWLTNQMVFTVESSMTIWKVWCQLWGTHIVLKLHFPVNVTVNTFTKIIFYFQHYTKHYMCHWQVMSQVTFMGLRFFYIFTWFF